MKQTLLVITIILSTLVWSCVKTAPKTADEATLKWSPSQIIGELKKNVGLIEVSSSNKERVLLIKNSRELAEECVMKDPENASCYYWRAYVTGLYYQSQIIGYQEGVKAMIKDCEKSVDLDPSVEHGGAYRILGKLYTELPSFTLTKNGTARDLELAEKYLYSATHIDPQFPENRLYLTETLLAKEKIGEAKQELEAVEDLLPQWNCHRDYNSWMAILEKLEKEIYKK
jgi:tetratricopeptide (TPR) repeat protein